jgi:hypothetical protein
MFRRTLQILLMALFANTATAHDFYGLLRVRDLSPFGFLRLDMQPAHAISIRPDSSVVEAEVGYQNSWALSPEVERYLTELEASGRRRLGAEELADIRALPGENYLVDVEIATVDVTAHHKLSPRVSAYFTVSAVSYDGGFLDATIESFHDGFGFSTFGRAALARNEVNLIYDLKSSSIASVGNAPSNGGLLDPTLGVRFSQFAWGRWDVSVEAAAKLALAGRRTLLSTGRSDAGIQLSAQYRLERQAFYANVAGVYYAGNEFPVRQQRQLLPTLVLGYEVALSARTNLNLQGYASTTVYSRKETSLEDLLANKYQLSVGIRHRIGHSVLTFGVTENLQNLNNTPDIGFQLGFAWIPHRTLQ